MAKRRQSLGIIIPGTEMKQIKYEQVLDAKKMFGGYVRTLRKLKVDVPKHIEVVVKILSFIEPMYSEFKPKHG